uniref:uncharacterized protein LOC120342959 n=1 Tax=Styela clava TaxID=7725 RepID=UPI00193AAE6A|nr:uncharacterized protein LOC120342959 [Styela clava]
MADNFTADVSSQEIESIAPPCVNTVDLNLKEEEFKLPPLKHSPNEIRSALKSVQHRLDEVDSSNKLIKQKIESMLNKIMSYKSRWTIFQEERNNILKNISDPGTKPKIDTTAEDYEKMTEVKKDDYDVIVGDYNKDRDYKKQCDKTKQPLLKLKNVR